MTKSHTHTHRKSLLEAGLGVNCTARAESCRWVGEKAGSELSWDVRPHPHTPAQRDRSKDRGEGLHTETQALGNGVLTWTCQAQHQDLMRWKKEHPGWCQGDATIFRFQQQDVYVCNIFAHSAKTKGLSTFLTLNDGGCRDVIRHDR